MSAEDSDDSDEWGMEELTLPTPQKDDAKENANDADNDEDWLTPVPAPKAPPDHNKPEKEAEATDDRPMMIVDMTRMTQEQIHSKFDRNSVNDAEAASALRKKIEQDYDTYAKNSEWAGDGTVIPCGMSVWRGALSRLRDERPGHYFAPIFPPKK
jgi:hypothetical protein